MPKYAQTSLIRIFNVVCPTFFQSFTVKDLRRAGRIIFVFLLAAISFACAATTEGFDDGVEQKSRAAENEAAVKTARNNIEKFRKGDAQIKIVDAKGKPVPAATVKIKQLSHDFKFGCYLKLDDLAPEKLSEYEQNFARLFNFAVVGTYWDFIETERGSENWDWFEREIASARKMNVRIEAAPVLWGTNEAGTPKWLPRNKNSLNEALKNHIQTVLKRGQNTVEDWEIVNEPLAPKADVFARNENSEYVAEAFVRAREISPNGRLMINEYGVFGAVAEHNYNREKYLELLKKLSADKIPFDVIGIQAHANGEWFEPANVAAELERYSALGKPIQITEFSSQMFDYGDRKTPLAIAGNYRTGVWNAERQAEFYREFYTIAFGSQNVEAITTWGLDDERAWLPGIGLIDEKGAPKAAYQTLDRLINQEWKTVQTGATNSAGVYEFRGFYGEYEIEIISPKRPNIKVKFVLGKNAPNDLKTTLSD